MKAKTISIQIEKPCNQIWENMEDRTTARFCSSCEKSVIDFTNHSNAEIVKVLQESQQKVCGRLTSFQLAQLNYYTIAVPSNKHWLKYLGVLAIGLTMIASEAQAVNSPTKTEIVNATSKSGLALEVAPVKKVYGFVVDENNKPLAGIRVGITNSKYFAQTDKNGRYEMVLKGALNKEEHMIFVESLRYEASAKFNDKVEKQVNLKVYARSMVMGEIAISKVN